MRDRDKERGERNERDRDKERGMRETEIRRGRNRE
jgi:hypothetical protein